MRYQFTEKNFELKDGLKERAKSKIEERLQRLLPEEAEVNIAFKAVKLENRVEVTIPLPKRVLRAEMAAADMNAALDLVIDVLEKQLVKYKNKLRDKSRRDVSFKEELNYFAKMDEEEAAGEGDYKIERIKRFALKPMDSDEAVMEMELSGHGFYVFKNAATDEVNVVYKRNNGNYGLIEPEF
ncbi:MAG: ribosome-associated translation inhibitor RaiA [Clostridiales bacterium]|jgi:putative sigma-54 modulation protein|nr:ribosome-associated translation inhibitor RaiA [Clostridiales bacterium]